jgi:selenocysteine lyase/cysteine desulfurase
MHGRRRFLRHAGQAAAGLAALPLLAAGRPAMPAFPADGDPDYWERVRDLYPLTRDRAYLNAGGLGPAPYPVLDAVERLTRDLQRLSEHGHSHLAPAREQVAAFVGADPEEIAFTRNATEANSIVASGLDLRRGDEVVFESHAHPGGAFPWMARQLRDRIAVRLFEPDAASPAELLTRIESALTRRTRVLQVSHVTAPTGIRMPVREIAEMARARGIWFHIDGAQSAGMIPVDLHAIGCDSYATSGHKWMGGPHGTGFLYVRRDRLDEVAPTEIGAYSDGGDVRLPDRFSYTPTAVRFEPGTRDAPSVVGLAAAAAFQTRIGPAKIDARTQSLARLLQHRLREIPGVEVLTPADAVLSAAITTLRTARLPYDQLNRAYGEAGLRCRIVTEQGLDAVRVSTHLYNSEAEVERVVEATRTALDRA